MRYHAFPIFHFSTCKDTKFQGTYITPLEKLLNHAIVQYASDYMGIYLTKTYQYCQRYWRRYTVATSPPRLQFNMFMLSWRNIILEESNLLDKYS